MKEHIILLIVFLLQINAISEPSSAIKHVIVLVLENRSFDSVFGSLSLQNPKSNVNGLTGNEFNYLDDGTKIYVNKANSTVSYYDPGHLISDVTQQLYNNNNPSVEQMNLPPTMSGFAQNAFKISKTISAANEVMQYYTQKELPITYALAREYTIFDSWFSSVPGPTYPNRHFIHCATSNGRTTNYISILGYPFKTIYQSLFENKVSWKLYLSGKYSELFVYRQMRQPKYIFNTRSLLTFKKDCRDGTLPQYSFIEPDFEKNDDHPPHDMLEGELLVKQVYESLRSSPNWNSSLLLITYDEHGGFYDHVPPPKYPSKHLTKTIPHVDHFNFDRLGVRVPAIAVSPLVEKGGVMHSPNNGVYEHSSIAATLKKLFKMKEFLTDRDEWAAPFDDVVTLKEPRVDCPVRLPDI